jgi:hypothetical protein
MTTEIDIASEKSVCHPHTSHAPTPSSSSPRILEPESAAYSLRIILHIPCQPSVEGSLCFKGPASTNANSTVSRRRASHRLPIAAQRLYAHNSNARLPRYLLSSPTIRQDRKGSLA